MHADPMLPVIVSIVLAILVAGIIVTRLHQPHMVAYLLVGLIAGPDVLGLVTDQVTVSRLGSIGVMLLLFFVGMEISPRKLAANWMVPVIGTLLQIAVSVFAIFIIGYWLQWPLARILLLGFVISLSSTSVVLKLLQEWKELKTRAGQDVLGVLLVQDLAIVPMLIVLSILGGQLPTLRSVLMQIFGGLLIVILAVYLTIKRKIKIQLLEFLGKDHEMQVFAALALCFGMATITGYLELSSALGAFVAGMIVSSAKETHWVYKSLSSIRVIFIALFFVSVGMLINLSFFLEHWIQVTLMMLAAVFSNTLINAGILRLLGRSWQQSLYGASFLSQIGEFSFVLAAVGYQMHFVDYFAYNMTISVIALSLIFSPIWIAVVKRVFAIEKKVVD